MLSAHYNPPAMQSHTPLHPPHAHYGPVSSLLPTPPTSPPTVGMHPVESTISLLESLVAFYHQERMWVYRTRAQLEMGLLIPGSDPQFDTPGSVDAELYDDPDSPTQSAYSPDSTKSAENASSSPPTKWFRRKKAFNLRLEGISSARRIVARGAISKRPHPHLQHRARQSSNLNPASHGSSSAALPLPSASMASNANVSFYSTTTTTLASPYLSRHSFQPQTTANQQPLTPGSRHVPTPALHTRSTALPTHAGPLVLGAGGREPTVQILEMFERMMQARMESCERMTRIVREANKPGGGIGLRSVGGPVGGFGGPAGLHVGVEPQDVVGNYVQAGEPVML